MYQSLRIENLRLSRQKIHKYIITSRNVYFPSIFCSYRTKLIGFIDSNAEFYALNLSKALFKII